MSTEAEVWPEDPVPQPHEDSAPGGAAVVLGLVACLTPVVLAEAGWRGLLAWFGLVVPAAVLIVIAVAMAILGRRPLPPPPAVSFSDGAAFIGPTPGRTHAFRLVLLSYLSFVFSQIGFITPRGRDDLLAVMLTSLTLFSLIGAVIDLIARRPRLELDAAGVRGGVMRRRVLWSEVLRLELKPGGELILHCSNRSWPVGVRAAPRPEDRRRMLELVRRYCSAPTGF